jgi:hypothetical protein
MVLVEVTVFSLFLLQQPVPLLPYDSAVERHSAAFEVDATPTQSDGLPDPTAGQHHESQEICEIQSPQFDIGVHRVDERTDIVRPHRYGRLGGSSLDSLHAGDRIRTTGIRPGRDRIRGGALRVVLWLLGLAPAPGCCVACPVRPSPMVAGGSKVGASRAGMGFDADVARC